MPEKEKFTFLTSVSDFEVDLICKRLKEAGVEYFVMDRAGNAPWRLYGAAGWRGKEIFVLASENGKARELLGIKKDGLAVPSIWNIRRGYFFVSLCILFLIIIPLLISGGISVWQYAGAQKQQTKSSEQQKTQDETANWRTYADTQYGFSFKYPTDWNTSKQGVYTVLDSSDYSGEIITSPIGQKVTSGTRIFISPHENLKSFTPNQLVQDYVTQENRKQITVGGVQGIVLDTVVEGGINETVIALVKNNFTYMITRTYPESYKNQNEKIFDQIISTFKFTDQNQTTDTSNLKTYTNTQYGFEVKYPTDTRVLETNNYTTPALNTNKDIAVAIQTTNSNYPRSLTGLNIFVNKDLDQCLLLSNGQKIAETKSINGITFFVYGRNIPDDAMGGIRSLFDEYRITHNNRCYSITSSVFWKDVSFVYGATGMQGPSSQEFEEEQDWIKFQQELNNQVLPTFQFTR